MKAKNTKPINPWRNPWMPPHSPLGIYIDGLEKALRMTSMHKKADRAAEHILSYVNQLRKIHRRPELERSFLSSKRMPS